MTKAKNKTQEPQAPVPTKSNHQHINQSSGDTDKGTPGFILDAAREVLGEIDLDPASSAFFNERVRAGRFFSQGDDGLEQEWSGRVWMNHPSGKDNKRWTAKLVEHYLAGDVDAACCLTWSSTSEQWFHSLIHYPQCFLHKRVRYLDVDGKPLGVPPKGSVVTYLGRDVERFARVFEALGTVKVVYPTLVLDR